MDIRLDTVAFEVGTEPLNGTLMQPAEPLPAILFVHGWGGSQRQDLARARDAAAIGTVCLTFDLRGHEPGSPQFHSVTRPQNLADLIAAYDWLVARPNVDENAIAVVGVSYGGYLATILSTLRPIRWLALRSPALYKDADWERPKLQLHLDADLPAYRHRRLDWHDNRALRACADFRGDVLLVEADSDEIVPHAVTENYVTAFSHTRSLTSRRIGADHAFTSAQAQTDYSATLLKWLTEMIGGGRKALAKERLDVHQNVQDNGRDRHAAA